MGKPISPSGWGGYDHGVPQLFWNLCIQIIWIYKYLEKNMQSYIISTNVDIYLIFIPPSARNSYLSVLTESFLGGGDNYQSPLSCLNFELVLFLCLKKSNWHCQPFLSVPFIIFMCLSCFLFFCLLWCQQLQNFCTLCGGKIFLLLFWLQAAI